MESYTKYSEYQQQYITQEHHHSPINYYGFNYNSYNYLPPYTQVVDSNQQSNSFVNSYSASNSAASSNSSSHSQSNSFFSNSTSPLPNYEANYSSFAKSFQSETDSPTFKSYACNTQNACLTSSYTPSFSHYKPTPYSVSYTSTPYQMVLNSPVESTDSDKSVCKRKDPTTKQPTRRRPKVIKLNISQTSIGFGGVTSTVLPSDINLSTNNPVKSFPCSECNASFNIVAKLFMHQHKHHKNRSSTECPVCYKKFNSPANALVHLRAHTQEKTYKCEECSLAFCDSSTLKKHIRTHTGEKPYACNLCLKSFAQSGNLKRHLAVHEKYDAIQAVSTKHEEQFQQEAVQYPVSSLTDNNHSYPIIQISESSETANLAYNQYYSAQNSHFNYSY